MKTALLLLLLLFLVATGQWFGPPPPRHFEFHDGHDSQSVEEETEVIHRKKIKNRHHERHGVHDEMGQPPPPPPIPPPGLGLPPPHIGLQNLVSNLNASLTLSRSKSAVQLGGVAPRLAALVPMVLRLLLFLFFLTQGHASQYSDEYEQCVSEGFGQSTFVCDPTKRLAESTRNKLDGMLKSLQTKIGCECPDGCRRADGSDSFIGMLHVSDSSSTKNLSEDVKKEYRTAALGNATCDHGLDLVYLKDTQQLGTYRGGDSFVLLTDEDMKKLHELAAKGPGEGDTLALQFLLQNYKDVVDTPVHKSQSFFPLIGLIAAGLIVALILAVLLGLFINKYCCCCVKNKKDVYHVNTLPSYKTIEPLYILLSGHTNHAMSDAIYSTPYSGSPLPYPPPPGSSVPRTPSSTGRHRVNGVAGLETPVMKKKEQGVRSEPGSESLRRDDLYMTPPEGFMSPGTEIYGTIPRATLSAKPKNAGDPEWLDPYRKQEVQTREELIY